MHEYRTIYNQEKIYPQLAKLTINKVKRYVPLQTSTSSTSTHSTSDPLHSQTLSLSRTKTTIKDIILCNSFDLFATFTFKSDRQDINKCRSKMTNWLHSQQKLHGSFDYLVIPEFHKDKQSIHFHALFNGFTGTTAPKINKQTGKQLRIKGKPISRFTGWHNGFSDCSPIADSHRLSNYITKYITKDMITFKNKQRYFVSQNLIRPIKSINVDPSPYYNDPDSQTYEYEEIRVIKRKLHPSTETTASLLRNN